MVATCQEGDEPDPPGDRGWNTVRRERAIKALWQAQPDTAWRVAGHRSTDGRSIDLTLADGTAA